MGEVLKTRISAAEFLQLPESTQPTELLDGELTVSPAPIPLHQRASRQLERVIEDLKPNGEVFHAPIDLYLDADNIPQPDIIWVAENSRCKVGEKYLEGPPELIGEIISPGTERQDRKKKYNLYQRFAVPEYWMADPVEQYIEVYVIQDGEYKRLGVFEPGDSFVSPILDGKIVEVSRIFGK